MQCAGEADEESVLEEPLLQGMQHAAAEAEERELQRRITVAVLSSLAGNIALLLAKGLAFFMSWSMAVLASLMDTVIDLASQAVIAWADWEMGRESAEYPAGKARLETLSVLACAFIMIVGAIQVVTESGERLFDGWAKGQLPEVDMGPVLFAILGGTIVLKLGLWAYCYTLRHQSGAALALAEDHLNDVVSNTGAIVTAAVASQWSACYWWADPVGGIAISMYIVARWIAITKRQVEKIVGKSAPPEFLRMVRKLAACHSTAMGGGVGFLRAYHVGQRLAVDVELTVPARMTVGEAAALARELKGKIEGLPKVECAAVFVVQLASGVFRPLRSGQPLLAPAAASKPRTTATNMEELLDGLEDFSLQTPIPTPRQELEGLTGEQDEAGRAVLSPSPTLSEPGRISPAMNVPREGASGHMRRAASLSDVALLRRASQPGLLGAEPALARQLVWTRSLKDAPERVLQSASLMLPDSSAMLLAKLSRRSAGKAPAQQRGAPPRPPP